MGVFMAGSVLQDFQTRINMAAQRFTDSSHTRLFVSVRKPGRRLLTFANSPVLLCVGCAVFISACSDSNPSEPFVPVVTTSTEESAVETETPALEPDVTDEAADEATDENTAIDDVVEVPVSASALMTSYSLTFEADWSVETHPVNFPDDPHLSGLVGAVHNEQAVLWEPGQIASNGVEVVAESGAKTLFLEEINSVIIEGRALSAIDEAGIPESPGQRTIEFEVTADYPLVTVLSMLAPSPDWIVGVHGLNLMQDGAFIDSMTIELELYDAGTDSGTSYTSEDDNTQPRDIISLVTSDPADSDFINGLPSVGRFVIVRQ